MALTNQGPCRRIRDWIEPDPSQWGEADLVPGHHAGTTVVEDGLADISARWELVWQEGKMRKMLVSWGRWGYPPWPFPKFIAYGVAIEKEGVQQEGEMAEKEGVEGKEGKQMEK
ncbi:hypothetical protein BDK51DRAFT_29384 [Blyttiomyces helicus]|uniref:Uncharacterized protein n=1 Tax=Blyttiomyces helicus TaxID=388810 RepID=A0A4P9WK40_9FUNG|nr:hypothetical protein BDK51DRAFT_29384 [Blyttiomyces helicus]|eukprot:RKO92455.1 hypothetical protein BDK51DRAFT_29384 [Blyttiomyces helicus]